MKTKGPLPAKLDPDSSLDLFVEHAEDLWELYNLIRPGDAIRGTTYRKVHDDRAADSTGARSSEKLKLVLEVSVQKIDYDMDAGELRFGGANLTENDHVKLGAFHSITVEPHAWVRLTKSEWDDIDVDRVKQVSIFAADGRCTATHMSSSLQPHPSHSPRPPHASRASRASRLAHAPPSLFSSVTMAWMHDAGVHAGGSRSGRSDD